MNDYKELISDLISASERNSNSLNTRSTCKKAADAIEQLVKERDAEPVRHGHWEKEQFLVWITHRCNLCGENYDVPHGIFHYCPNCGAKMDEESTE